jgi:hypothetical protein
MDAGVNGLEVEVLPDDQVDLFGEIENRCFHGCERTVVGPEGRKGSAKG